MARSNNATRLLCGLMFLGGGASLFACLFLPPWLEVRALRQAHIAARHRIAKLEERLTRVAKQIEHLQDDPAYLERLARKELGIETTGVEIIRIDTPDNPVNQPTAAPAPTTAGRDDALATGVEQAARTSPFLSVFVLDETRPIVMAMSGVLMIVALALLLRGGASERR
ncbi:MAG: septum formation initiator family protein [Phycisphaerae bacterium]